MQQELLQKSNKLLLLGINIDSKTNICVQMGKKEFEA